MASGVVERYLESIRDHEWDALAACLADDFTRVGPYGDTYSSKPEYLAFISDLMPRLPGYSMEITRVTYADGVAFAELSETVEVKDGPLRTPECLTFALTADGLIARVEVFIQTAPPTDNPLAS
ncbi:MAG: nuclear transport factor 2 family protein [Acidimicrobiia bacterium]